MLENFVYTKVPFLKSFDMKFLPNENQTFHFTDGFKVMNEGFAILNEYKDDIFGNYLQINQTVNIRESIEQLRTFISYSKDDLDEVLVRWVGGTRAANFRTFLSNIEKIIPKVEKKILEKPLVEALIKVSEEKLELKKNYQWFNVKKLYEQHSIL